MEAEKEERVKLEFDDVCIELNIDQETKDNAWESYMMIYNDYVLEVRKNGVILSLILLCIVLFLFLLSLFVVSLSFLCLFLLRLHVHVHAYRIVLYIGGTLFWQFSHKNVVGSF